MDSDFSEEDEHCSEEPVAASYGNPSRVFSKEVQECLRSLYAQGMTGWGKKHAVFLDVAKEKTGLKLSQIQVIAAKESLITVMVVVARRLGLQEP